MSMKIIGNLGYDCTNNTAEYMSLIMGLIFMQVIKVPVNLSFIADSELVCKQMTGSYKTKTPHIIVLNNIVYILFIIII